MRNRGYAHQMITADAIWDFPTPLVTSFTFLSTKPDMMERQQVLLQMAIIPLEGRENKWPFAGLSEKWKVPKSAILLETSGLKIFFATDLF